MIHEKIQENTIVNKNCELKSKKRTVSKAED